MPSSMNQNLQYVCLSMYIIQNDLHLQNQKHWKEEKVSTFKLKYPRLNEAESRLGTLPFQRVFQNFPWFMR